jgi:hypothetical protein
MEHWRKGAKEADKESDKDKYFYLLYPHKNGGPRRHQQRCGGHERVAAKPAQTGASCERAIAGRIEQRRAGDGSKFLGSGSATGK